MAILMKQPSEMFPIGIDFTGQLPDDTTLVSGAVSARDLVTNTDVTATFLQTSVATIQGTSALFRIRAGTAGRRYKVTLVVTLTTGDILEEDIWVDVHDP